LGWLFNISAFLKGFFSSDQEKLQDAQEILKARAVDYRQKLFRGTSLGTQERLVVEKQISRDFTEYGKIYDIGVGINLLFTKPEVGFLLIYSKGDWKKFVNMLKEESLFMQSVRELLKFPSRQSFVDYLDGLENDIAGPLVIEELIARIVPEHRAYIILSRLSKLAFEKGDYHLLELLELTAGLKVRLSYLPAKSDLDLPSKIANSQPIRAIQAMSERDPQELAKNISKDTVVTDSQELTVFMLVMAKYRPDVLGVIFAHHTRIPGGVRVLFAKKKIRRELLKLLPKNFYYPIQEAPE
jgi:hypothetical protein